MATHVLPAFAIATATALLFVAIAMTTTSAQTDQFSASPADDVERLESIANETAFQDEVRSHTWSDVEIVPASSTENITVSCDSGSHPTGGGFVLGSSDLQVLSSHAFANQTSKGWTATITNTNASASFPAMVDVICLPEVGVTAPITPGGVPPVAPDAPEPDQDFTITTDSDSYSAGDTITISGTVTEREAGSQVIIEIFDSDSDRDWLEIVPVFADNTYRLTIEAGEPENEFSDNEIDTPGMYLVTASYRTPDSDYLDADTSFEYED